jgi:MFS family permease
MVTFLGAGPAIAIPEMTITFFGPPSRDFSAHIAKIAFFITTTPFTQGVGQLLWMPAIIKYGRRPVIVISFTLFTLTSVWCGVATSYASELAARILMGFAAGAIECAAPLIVADLFFLHERGTMMSYVQFPLADHLTGHIVYILLTDFILLASPEARHWVLLLAASSRRVIRGDTSSTSERLSWAASPCSMHWLCRKHCS